MGLFASASGGADAVITVGLEGKQAVAEAKKVGEAVQTSFADLGLKEFGEQAEDAFKGIIPPLEKVKDSVEDIKEKTDDSAASASKFGATLGTLVGSLAGMVSSAVTGFAFLAKSMSEAGEKLGSLETAFKGLGGDSAIIGEASDRILGLASNTDLLAVANKAMVMGLPDINENFADIVDLGGRMANALGKDVTGSVEALTQAIAKGEVEQLAQFGLFMDTAAAAKQYAEANNIAGRSLTESENIMAKQAFALEQVKQRLGEIPPISESVANSISAMGNQMSDMYDEAGKIINSNPELIKGLEDFRAEMANIDLSIFAALAADALAFAARIAADLIPWATTFGQTMQALIQFASDWKGFMESAFVVTIEGFKAVAGEAKVAWLAMIPGARTATDTIGLTTAATERFQRTLAAVSQAQVPSWSKAIEGAAKKHLEFKASIIDVGEESKKTGAGLKRDLNPALADAEAAAKKAKEKTGELVDIYKSLREQLVDEQITKFIKNMNAQFLEGKISIQEVSKEFEIFRSGLPALGIEMKAFDKNLGNFNLSLDKTGKVADKTSKSLSGLEKLQAQIGEGIAKGFDFSGITGGDVLNGILPVAGQLADKFIDETTTGIGAAIGAVIGGTIAAVFSLGIGTAGGAAIGALVGDAAEGLSMNMNLFGGSKQHETVARRNVQAYFDEVFKETDFYLRGESGRFTRFEDFDLGPRQLFEFKPGLGADFLQQIQQYPDAIHNVFRGVGGAVASMFEEDFIGGTQVGTSMMVAFGGDIDALKIVVQELGLTFEDFKESMIGAFFEGSISALEYNSIIRDANEVFAEGIVGVGEWAKAFQNFIDSAGQGRLAVKSLKDMAVEFMEAGGTSLAGFRQALEASGQFTTAQIEQLFQALSQRGVNSLEDLRNASDDSLISIIGDLQAMGFEFGETFGSAAEEMNHLREQIEKIPSEINSRVNIEVAAKFRNEDDRRAFDYVTRGGPGIESSP